MRFYTANTERLRIDSSGRLLVGTSSNVSVGSVSGALLQVEHPGGFVRAFYCTATSAQGGTLVLGHGRGSATTGVLQSGDTLGDIRFAGADGTDLVTQGAKIAAEVDGTYRLNDMPGRLVFSTTADGAVARPSRCESTARAKLGLEQRHLREPLMYRVMLVSELDQVVILKCRHSFACCYYEAMLISKSKLLIVPEHLALGWAHQY